jgi:uncharacterized RDD family membrane protein YckC
MSYTATTFDASGLYDTSARPAPLARFFAKNIDIALFMFGFALAVGVFGLVSPDSEAWIWAPLIGLAIFPFFESASHFLVGNTLGKKLLGLRVLDRTGTAPSFSQLLQRNYRCYVQGLGLGVPVASLVTNVLGFVGYTRAGVSNWDREAGTVCERHNASIWRSLLIGLSPFWLPLAIIVIVSAGGSNLSTSYSEIERSLGTYE